MRVYGLASLHQLLGDFVAYRSVRPVDARLPSEADLAPTLGIAPNTPLRKGDRAYAQVVAAILAAARALDAPDTPLRKLIFIGDTRMSDGGAFTTLCAETGWQGRAFIGHDAPDEAPATHREAQITFANRWSALADFAQELEQSGFTVDASTVVALDLDKTLLGARGRNDALIDAARLGALRASVAELLGAQFDAPSFDHTYRTINQTHFHPFTADNQDYVAVVCVMVGGGVVALDTLLAQIERGDTPTFAAFIEQLGSVAAWPSVQLRAFYEGIAALVAAGDPTPFKAFREREYRETAALMGVCLDDIAADDLLHQEITLTGEVWAAAQAWRERGALLFGLSDKPDEAALPPAGSADTPLHHLETHIVGDTE